MDNDFTAEEEMKIDDNHWMNVTIAFCASSAWISLMLIILDKVGVIG